MEIIVVGVDRVEISIWSKKFLYMIWKLWVSGGNYNIITSEEFLCVGLVRISFSV